MKVLMKLAISPGWSPNRKLADQQRGSNSRRNPKSSELVPSGEMSVGNALVAF
jgi:hypothetical protein